VQLALAAAAGAVRSPRAGGLHVSGDVAAPARALDAQRLLDAAFDRLAADLDLPGPLADDADIADTVELVLGDPALRAAPARARSVA